MMIFDDLAEPPPAEPAGRVIRSGHND
jgi:hypothetical protein